MKTLDARPPNEAQARRRTSVEPRDLGERILDCFPAGHYLLGTFLRVVSVVESDEVQTAAVECTLQPRMLVNPAFVRQEANTPERLLMLVMHELLHIALGHTRALRHVTEVDNLVFDAVINAMLCRMFPHPDFTSLLTGCYSDRRFPECLLRPPANWKPDGDVVPTPPALRPASMQRAAGVYRSLYSKNGVSSQELYEILRGSIDADQMAVVSLLGDHRPDRGFGGGPCSPPAIHDVVRQVTGAWPSPPRVLKEYQTRDPIREYNLNRLPSASNRAALRHLLRRVAGLGDRHEVAGEMGAAVMQSALPAPDRRSIVLRAMGVPTLLYTHRQPDPRVRRGDRTHVYVDVSESIGPLRAALYGAVWDCRDFVHPIVHLFSTAVADVSLAQLRQGVCWTTGGTNIRCVARHVESHQIRRAVLVTDGWVGRPVGKTHATLAAIELGVALTPDRPRRQDLAGVAGHWVLLGQCPRGAAR